MSNVEVQVTPDIAEFRERLRQILPNENIEVRTANDGIVLSGTVSTPRAWMPRSSWRNAMRPNACRT